MELVISAALIAVAFVLVVYFFLRNDEKRRRGEYREKALSEVMPNRLQAYERITLYLDRINPENMALREQLNATSAKDLHVALMNCVRQEFEHNVAMQIYISEGSWNRVLKAKAEVLKAINETIKSVAPTASPIEYAAQLIEYSRNNTIFYIDRAIGGLRKDLEGEFSRM